MLEKTKKEIRAHKAKMQLFEDPAPMPGSDILKIAKAFKEDITESLKKKKEKDNHVTCENE